MMTVVCGAISRLIMEVGGATSHMMKVSRATKSNSSNCYQVIFISVGIGVCRIEGSVWSYQSYDAGGGWRSQSYDEGMWSY